MSEPLPVLDLGLLPPVPDRGGAARRAADCPPPGGGIAYQDKRLLVMYFDSVSQQDAPRAYQGALDYIDRHMGNIEKDPTRVRVATILTCSRHGMSVEEIVHQYAHLKPADVHDVLAYAYDHLDEIEKDLAGDDERTAKARHRNGGACTIRS